MTIMEKFIRIKRNLSFRETKKIEKNLSVGNIYIFDTRESRLELYKDVYDRYVIYLNKSDIPHKVMNKLEIAIYEFNKLIDYEKKSIRN